MKRREFITLLGGAAAAWPLAARAQQAGKLPTIGFLGTARLRPGPLDRRFCAAAARTRLDRGPHRRDRVSLGGGTHRALLPRSRPSSSGSRSMSLSRRERAVLAAKQATSVIPIVFAVAADPVGTGLVASLARPGGNVTGLSIQQTDLAGKRLELLREVVPGLRRLAIMANVGYPAAVLEMERGSGSGPHARPRSRHIGNPASGGYRARLRGAQGSRGRALCLCRPAREHQPDSHQHLGARRATADDATAIGSTSKREV